MICKIFKRGTGRASGIDYLISDKDALGRPRNPPAELVAGDVAITKQLIAGSPFVQRYTSGALSWSEAPECITSDQVDQVIQSFQNMVCAGVDAERVNWLWVKHQDKGRLELHFVIPNIDLLTGKRFAPYYDRADRALFRAWERHTNAMHEFTNPADPKLKRLASIPPFIPSDKKQAMEIINGRLSFLMRAGHIKTRSDVLQTLKGIGFEINRAGKDYISIKDKTGKKLRLRGALFEEDFQRPAKLTDSPNDLNDLGALQAELNTQLEKRSRYFKQRFGRAEDSFKDVSPINFIAVKEVISDRNTIISSGINSESGEDSGEALSKLAVAVRSLATAIEILISCARNFIERIGSSEPDVTQHNLPSP